MAPPEFDRRTSLDRLAREEFDLLVVGGGITGCGVALDAAARGLKTALVEASDFASGTSSKSSKMVHGGLRYLQQHDYLLVYEALHERQRLLRNAPHLVHPLPFLIPLFGRDGILATGLAKAYSIALWLYDLTGGVRIGKRHQRISAAEAISHFPQLRTDRLVAAFLYWDAQADDARLTLAIARTAASRGAVVANYSRVVSLTEVDGTVRGARLADGTEIKARVVVNAGGVWSEEIAWLAGDGSNSPVSIRPAKGIHLAVPSEKLPCDQASVLMVPGDRRSIFVVPWAADEARGTSGPGRYTYMGTTDTDYDGSLEDPRCTPDDVEYVLRAVNAWTSASLTAEDVTGTWAGLRPLISDARSERTADLSRRHKVLRADNGLITVTGGKLTTYRRMAADTVDAVVGAPAGLRPASGRLSRRRKVSPTKDLTITGGGSGGRPGTGAPEMALALGLTEDSFAHLAGRHGSETGAVLDLCRENAELAKPLIPGLPYLKAEAVYSARHEMVHTLTDMLARRTRALILDRNKAGDAAREVAAVVGEELGWDADEQARQVYGFLAEVEAEEQSVTASVAG